MLSGGVRLKPRVQHAKIDECRDRGTPYWLFRYWADELSPDGSIKTSRKRRIVGPIKGEGAITRKAAEIERDRLLLDLKAAPSSCLAVARTAEPEDVGASLFGKLAEMWRRDFFDGKVDTRALIAASTRAKCISHLENHILPRWKDTRPAQLRAKDVLDWLENKCQAWYMMVDLRNIIGCIFSKAQEWEILPDSDANPRRRRWPEAPPKLFTNRQTGTHQRDARALAGPSVKKTAGNHSADADLRVQSLFAGFFIPTASWSLLMPTLGAGRGAVSTIGQTGSNSGARATIMASVLARTFILSSNSTVYGSSQRESKVEVYGAKSIQWISWASGGKCSPS